MHGFFGRTAQRSRTSTIRRSSLILHLDGGRILLFNFLPALPKNPPGRKTPRESYPRVHPQNTRSPALLAEILSEFGWCEAVRGLEKAVKVAEV